MKSNQGHTKHTWMFLKEDGRPLQYVLHAHLLYASLQDSTELLLWPSVSCDAIKQPIILQYCFLVQAAALLNQRGKKIKITPSIFTIIMFCWCRFHPHRYMMHQQEEPKVPSQEMMRSRAGLSNRPSVSCHNCHLQSLTKRCPRIYRTVSRVAVQQTFHCSHTRLEACPDHSAGENSTSDDGNVSIFGLRWYHCVTDDGF